MRTITIIQARTSSSRLPAKALLQVAGYPSAILAALRAANRNHETILATSDDPSDDELARRAQSHRIAVFRGPLHDVLERYYLASANLPEDTAVIRLTADNVVPDGQLVEELAQAFNSAKTDYMNTDSLASGLPYGLGGEVFSVAALRRAHREATSSEDREHVGPWIRRNCRPAVYSPQRSDNSDYSFLRCTIDDAEDYERIVRLFDGVADPLHVGWQSLLHKLAEQPGEARFRVPYRIITGRAHSRLTLGTAQLGMEYGAVNDSGKPSIAQAVAIIHRAIAHGVTALDTARSYGTAEEVLGTALGGAWASRTEVITKLDLSGLKVDADASRVRAAVDEGVRCSCESLGVRRLAVLLLHGWHDHDSWSGAAWRRLVELRDQGTIGRIGASVYRPAEALEALQDPAIEHLQIPLNVLDWRWETAGIDRALAVRSEVVLHARSALLQGVLAHPSNRWPAVNDFDAREAVGTLERLAREFRRESVIDLCLAYVRSLPWVTSVVVGCESMMQLDENLKLCRTPELTLQQCEQIRREIPLAPENLLNPSKWEMPHEHSAAR